MIKGEDIKVGLKFIASLDGLFYTDISESKKHVFSVKGFEVHDNEVYVLTDCSYSFPMKALLGASNRYQMFYPDDVSVNELEKNDKTTAVTLEGDPFIMTKIAVKKFFDGQNKFFTEVKKERDLAKCLKLVREVRDSCIAQSQLKVTLDYLKDYIGVLKNEPDARSFKKITDEMYDTFKAKNHDYGSSFSNLFKECGMIYAYGHMAEKLERMKSLMKDEAKVKGEGLKDSLKDLANYAILTIMELERKEEE